MAGYQQKSSRYPSLLVTVKRETNERLVSEIPSKPRAFRSKNHSYSNSNSNFFYATTTYYNSNIRCQQPKQYSRHLPSSSTYSQYCSQNNNRGYYHNQYQQQSLCPLMKTIENRNSLPDGISDNHINFSNIKPREQKQRGQYRNRRVELDWDHAFDLDQIGLYTAQNDIDNDSLTSIHSSGDSSLSSA